jgi:putative DNA primase/helicase
MKNPGHRGVGGQGAAWKCRSDRSHNIHSATRCATPSVILASRPHVYAAEIGAALGGRKSGRGWSACCPAHDDSTPSLSIQDADDGRVLVHCHAGCEQAEVITALKARGLWPKNSGYFQRPTIECKSEHDDAERTNAALAILHAAGPASGTPVESYLTARGIKILVPDSLRFHAGLKHPLGRTWPAMVALVTSGVQGTPMAIHRTFLAGDGGSKAPVEPPKMMLGPCRGGAVRLADPGDVLMVGEWIETCLAAMQACGNPAWAALSTAGLRSLDLPRNVRDVIVLADGDEAGEAAAKDSARRWVREGRRVRIAIPPRGMDFNDMLMAFRSGIAFANTGPGNGPASAKVTASLAEATVGDLPWR